MAPKCGPGIATQFSKSIEISIGGGCLLWVRSSNHSLESPWDTLGRTACLTHEGGENEIIGMAIHDCGGCCNRVASKVKPITSVR